MGVNVEKCLQAWTNSLRQMHVKADVVFYGDSLTYYGDFSSQFPNQRVCNLGLRGDTIEGVINRLEQVQLLDPKVVYLMVGINDVANCTLDVFRNQYESLVAKLQEFVPNAEVFIQSMLPVNDIDFTMSCNNELIVECNKQIADIASKYHYQFINLFSEYVVNGVLPKDSTIDGLHLKISYYAKWYLLLKKMLRIELSTLLAQSNFLNALIALVLLLIC